MTKNHKMFLLFMFIVLTWGLSWPINKIGLMYMPPVWYAAFRLMVGAATMMLLVACLGKLTWPSVKDIPLILIVGLLQIAFYIMPSNLGLTYLPPGRSALLAYTTPFFVMPAAVFIFGEEAPPIRWIGFFLGMGGLMLLLSPWELDWSDSNVLFGAAMLLLASFCWAVSMLAIRYMRWYKSPLELIPWQLLIGTLPILLFALIKEPVTSIEWNMPLILSLVYTGFLVTGISYWLGVIINKELPTTVLSLGFLTVPVFSLVVSSYFMHETINLPTSLSMFCIIVGSVCIVV